MRKRNYVYGIGILGKILYCELQDKGVEIDGIVVSDGYKKEESYMDTPIFELSEIVEYSKNSTIYLTVINNKKIICELKNKGFAKVLDFSDVKRLDEFQYKKIKINAFKNIDLSSEYILFNKEFKICNPFKMNGEYKFSFFTEYGDLILPSCNKDYSHVNEGPYEYDEVHLNEGDIVIDAGANIGIFSTYAASKKCTVYAFEPIEGTLNLLKKNVKLYDNSIKICRYALGNKNEKIKCYIDEQSNTSSSIIKRNNNEKYIEVQATTIDNFVKANNLEKVDFIKADIEGAERFMLEGAKETLAKFAPKLSICTYHLYDDPEVLENLIKKYNSKYVVKHNWKKLFAYVPL